MVIHKHEFENVLDLHCIPSSDRDVQILICDECQTIKVIYGGKKPKYVRK